MQRDTRIIYRIDRNGTIVFVNDEWDRFANLNSGADVVSEKVMNDPLEECIEDSETRNFYSRTIDGVRNGNKSIFQFRCDSPERLRLLEMRVELTADGLVEFTSRPIWIQERPQQLLLDTSAPRTPELLLVCSWCKRICVDGEWIEVADAQVFKASELPTLTHGVCDDCNANLRKTITAQQTVSKS